MASNEYPVAVIGIACRTPQCKNASQFWQFIQEKKQSISEFPSNRIKDIDHVLTKIETSDLSNPEKPFFPGSYFESIDTFDAKFFGISQQEAEAMDPQHRFFLETAWEAIEDAGIACNIYGSKTGVYTGDTTNKYSRVLTENSTNGVFGTLPQMIPSRLSYTLDLKGPTMVVGVGCSSSLLAVHLACQGIRSGDCNVAIAGGVTIDCTPINEKFDVWNLVNLLNTEEEIHCCPFDQKAKGYVKGEGCSIVVLKPLSEAIKDGNHIYGVIAGSAANQKARGNGLSTPNPKALCDVTLEAWRRAAVDANDIDYFEASGTSKSSVDAIEMTAIQMAFETSKRQSAGNGRRNEKPYLGAVTANVCHLVEGAAGVTGLIKVLLAMEHETIPPQTNYNDPNPLINWKKCPVRVNTENVEWKVCEDKSRVASVSSFGTSGTNVHLVVRDFKSNSNKNEINLKPKTQPILLSAASQRSLKMFTEELGTYLSLIKDSQNAMFFEELAYTLNAGRDHKRLPFKSLIFAENIKELIERLAKVSEYLNSYDLKPFDTESNKNQTQSMNSAYIACFVTDTKKKMKFNGINNFNKIDVKWNKLIESILNRDPIDWKAFHSGHKYLLPMLPTYCFDKQRYWPSSCQSVNSIVTKVNSCDTSSEPFSDSKSSHCSSHKDYYSLSDEKQTMNGELTPENIEVQFREKFSFVSGLTIDDWETYNRYSLLDVNIDVHVIIEVFILLCKQFQTTNLNLSMDDINILSTLKEISNVFTDKLMSRSTNEIDPSKFSLKIFSSTSSFLLSELNGELQPLKHIFDRNDTLKMNDCNMKIIYNNDIDCVVVSLDHNIHSYGIVSVVFYKTEEPSLVIEQWLLSNDALNYDVKRNILQYLQKIAKNTNCDNIRIKVGRNEKYDQALGFLQNIGFKEIGYLNSVKLLSFGVFESITLNTYNTIYTDKIEELINQTVFKDELNFEDIDKQVETKEELKDTSIDERLDNNVEDELLTNNFSYSKVYEAWYENLGVKPKNTSNFFHCGGTSLKAVNFIAKLREELGLDFRLSHIYRYPTFGKMCQQVDLLESIKLAIPSEMDPNHLKLSSFQKKLLTKQQLSPSSTAFIKTVAVSGLFKEINLETLLKYLLEEFPHLAFVIEENGNSEKSMSMATVDNIVRSSIIDTVFVETKEAAIQKANEMRQNLSANIGQSMLKIACIAFKNNSKLHKMVVLYLHQILVDDLSLFQIEEYLLHKLEGGFVPQRTKSNSFIDFLQIRGQYSYSDIIQKDLESIEKSFKKTQAITTLGFSSEIWSDAKAYDCESKRFEIELNISSVCRYLDIQPFHYFLCCYLLTLKRYSANSDLSTCVTVNTRSAKFEDSFGAFFSEFLYRIEIKPEIDFQTLVQTVVSKWLQLQDTNLLPISDLLSYLHEKSKIDDICLSNVFKYSKFPKNKSSVYIPPLHSNGPFSVAVCEELMNKFIVTVEWSPIFVENIIANNFSESFLNICKKLVNNFSELKNQLISKIDVMSETELNTIFGFNRPLKSTPNVLVHRYFENHCRENGDKIAVNFGNKSKTYNQINSMANGIAAYLQHSVNAIDLQTKPIVVVMHRNEVLIATILAIWKVGGFVLAISEDMQQQIIQMHTKKKYKFDLLLTNLSSEEIYVEIPNGIKIVNINQVDYNNQLGFEDKIDDCNPKTTIAYMFMTSGTTGEPKCCMITHLAFSIIIEALISDYQLNTFNVSVLQFSPVCFDAFLAEMAIGILSVCGSMTIVENSCRADPDKVRDLIVEQKISCCLITPQSAASLFLSMPQESLKNFRVLIVGGEEFPQNLYHNLSSKLGPSIKIVNAYGMTETSIVATNFNDSLKYLTSSLMVPIGRPVIGVNMFIIDPISKLPSPIGTAGELCISGVVVGKGDIKPEKLTFSGDDPVYMTGDKARWLPDGNIDFIGRETLTFHKINGVRVNLREIESVVYTNFERTVEEVRVFTAEDNSKENIICLVYKTSFGVNPGRVGNKIRKVIKSNLPYYMMPNVIKSVTEIPVTKSGKTDLKSLRKLCAGERQEEIEDVEEVEDPQLSAIEEMLIEYLKSSMTYSIPIEISTNFRDQGIHSLALIKFANKLISENVSGFDGVTDLFDYPNIKSLAIKINSSSTLVAPEIHNSRQVDDNKMAIVGVSFKLPKNISTITEFASTLLDKKSLVDEFPKQRANDFLTRLSSEDYERIKKLKTFKAAFLNEIDKFDNEFFDVLTTEAKHLCVEQRLWMEVATEALTDSGHIDTIHGSNTGVFVSRAQVKYDTVDSSTDAVSVVGKMASFIPTRLAYHFDLKGPTVSVDTVCSSGLVAMQQACEAIKLGSCDTAVVGGVTVFLYPSKEGSFSDNMMTLSPDSCCRTFDANANGAVPGEGVIAFVIEPLKKAIENNRFIYGVIESAAVNSVGRGNGITAPSVSSQKELITTAINAASLSTNDIKFIESHGTGTQLGDAIELTALRDLFKENVEPVFIGATKSSFGHLNEASGFLGILKVLTMLLIEEIPPAVNFDKPNIVLKNSKLIIPNESIKFKANEFKAGVSSFGLSGTNCHVILSRPKQNFDSSIESKLKSNYIPHPLLIRCNSFEEFQKQIDKYYFYIKSMIIDRKITSLAEMCATVCRMLKSTTKKRKQTDAIRLVLMLRNEEQSLNLLSQLRILEHNVICALAESNTDVIISTTGTNEFIDCFITSGYIDKEFYEQMKKLPNSPCVPVSIFQSVRHWPDCKMQNSDENIATLPKESDSLPNVNNVDRRTEKNYEEIVGIIREIWKSVLGIEEIEEEDIFRELGGESLLIIEMMTKVRKELNVDLDLGLCYAYPSLKALSVCVKSLLDESFDEAIYEDS